MTERTFVTIFILVTVLASGFVLINKLQESPLPSSTPSASGLNFNSSAAPSASASSTPAPSASAATSPKQFASFPLLAPADLKGKKATIVTDKGTIEFSISPEATKAASSFIFLSQNHFFDGLTFHRVEAGFVIQGGDPAGNGTGGPGYKFADEPFSGTYTKGTVAMANAGPNTNGSQFFIMLDDHPELPHAYTIFGHVTSGMDVVSKITVGDVMRKVTISAQ